MANIFEFVAENRDLSGKHAARAERRKGNIPAIIYGGANAPQSIVLSHNDIVKSLEHEAVYSHVLDLKIDGKTEKAILKDIQRHPARPQILHMDFMRVDLTHALKVKVPLHFINESECAGVKMGGVVTHAMVDVEVSCLPSVLPEFIEIDLTNLELGESIHLSDLIIPEGVEILALAQEGDHDHTVAQVMKVRGPQESDEEEASDEEGSSPEEE